MTTLEVLKAAREHLSDPARWCKHSFLVSAPNAGPPACCAIGGVRLERSRMKGNAINALEAALPSGGADVTSYNDDPSTTHADILALFDRAIAAEEARQ